MMGKNRWFGISLFLIFLAIAFLLGFYFGTRLTPREIGVGTPELGFPVSIINESEAEERLYELKVSYPRFPLLSESFNEKVRVFVEENIADFKRAARENMEARIATLPENERDSFIPEPFYFVASWTPTQMNDSFVSFVIHIYAYEGGANGREELATFNYDVKAKREVTLHNLFPEEGDNYLEKVSKFSRERLISELIFGGENEFMLDMLESGTAPSEENFKHFTFTDDAVIIYFEKYQVAPGSYGEQRVTIPRVIVR